MKLSLTEQDARRLVDEIAMRYYSVRLEDRVYLPSRNRLSNKFVLRLSPWMERPISSPDGMHAGIAEAYIDPRHPAGCGKTIVARWKVNGPYVIDHQWNGTQDSRARLAGWARREGSGPKFEVF